MMTEGGRTKIEPF